MERFNSLTTEQKEAVDTLKAITGTDDLNTLISILEAHDWNLESSTHFLLDTSNQNETSSLLTNAGSTTVSSSTNQPSNHPISSLNGNGYQNISAQQQQERATGGLTTSIFSLFTLPLSLFLKAISKLFDYTYKAVSFVTGSNLDMDLNLKRANNKFIAAFDNEFGSTHPEFFKGTYSQALEHSKKEIKYLFVYLHSPEHDDTEAFCRETICSSVLIDFLKEKDFCVWVGNIQNPEPFQVSQVLHASAYPFTALITIQGSRMITVDRFEGPMDAQELIDKLTVHTNRLDGQLAASRRDRMEREQARKLRQQQDAAYLASLRADEEKFRKQREEEERKLKEELRLQQAIVKREQKIEEKKKRVQKLKEAKMEEPDPSSGVNITKISIRLPNGTRLVRSFFVSDKVQSLMDYIEIQDLDPISFESDVEIVNTYPRKTIHEMNLSMEEAGLCPNASVFVEEKIDEDYDDEDPVVAI